MTKTISSRERLSPGLKKSDLVSSNLKSDEVKENQGAVAQSTGGSSLNGLQIIHATTSRIRIRATDTSHSATLDTICQKFHRQSGVKEIYINEQTGSLVINFDEKKLSLSQMLELLQPFGIDKSQLSPQSKSKIDPFAAWKSPDFWKEQGISLIPLFAGLAVTGRLGVSGFAALPVYFITTNATRSAISYLQSQFSAAEKSSSSDEKNNSAVKLNKVDQSLLSKVEKTSTDTSAQAAKITYNIVHAIPGRIRFSVPRVASDRAYARRLERLLKTDSHVTNARVNCDAASVAIAFGAKQIPVSHWIGLMQLADETALQTDPVKTKTEQQFPETKIQPTELTQLTEKNEERTLEVVGLWSDYKTPALSAALSFMANFPLDMVS